MADDPKNLNLDNKVLSDRLETDLSNMNYETAHNYVVSYITEYNEIQKKMQEQVKEKNLWADRVKLAQEKGKPELVRQAQDKIKDIEEKIIKYNNREDELKMTVDILKTELNKISVSSINQLDAEKILDELKLMSDDAFAVNKDITDLEIQDQLNKMKKI